MGSFWGRTLGLGMLVIFGTACGAGGNGDETPPPVPSNYFAYVVSRYSNNISAFSINTATGALTAVAGSPFIAGDAPMSVIVDPSGKFAYVGNFLSSDVS